MSYTDLVNKEKAIKLLLSRGVTIRDIADITLTIQKQYYENLTIEYCEENVIKVLEKTEVQNVIFTGIALDILCEKGLLPEPLNELVASDYPLYGVDEILALGIVNVYGSIGLTNFGYVDKEKVGIINKVDKIGKRTDKCMTFLDDIIGAIAASSASRIAHNRIKE
ncbi:phosphatidylglycerophosphatase A [Mycoplasmatota bacterium]|nr:phosphatidylglycerophosphatase A [Mycoplasmatota bacterium]